MVSINSFNFFFWSMVRLAKREIKSSSLLSAFRDGGGGSLNRRVNVAACPSPDGSSASAKGGSEAAGDRHGRGGNPAAFVFVPCPGRVRLQ
jgi:hypothetical protein